MEKLRHCDSVTQWLQLKVGFSSAAASSAVSGCVTSFSGILELL